MSKIRLKALANEARKEMRATGRLERNKSAAEIYDDVVGRNGSLAEKIERAKKEAPKERQAQALATSAMNAKIAADPSLKDRDNADKRKKCPDFSQGFSGRSESSYEGIRENIARCRLLALQCCKLYIDRLEE